MDYLYRNEVVRHGAGRPRLLNSHDELGLILFYLVSSMKLSELCLIFGCTLTRCSDIINFQLQNLSRRLRTKKKAKIYWSSSIEEKEYVSDLVYRREPKVDDVIGFTVGVSLHIQCASDPLCHYNGYHHDTMYNSACFEPTGKIIFACIYFPGS